MRAHSGMELGTWNGWADQLTHIFDPPMFLPHFSSRMTTSMQTWNEIYVQYRNEAQSGII